MNGQNGNLPAWFGIAIRIGGVLIAGVAAFTLLQAQVGATDLIAHDNKDKIEVHEERLDTIQMTQVEVVIILKGMEKTLEKIETKLEEHDE